MRTFNFIKRNFRIFSVAAILSQTILLIPTVAQAATTSVMGKVVADTTVVFTGRPSYDNDTSLIVKEDSYRYKRVAYVEVALPDMAIDEELVDSFELALYKLSARQTTQVKVYLEPSATLQKSMTYRTAPTSGVEVGSFIFSSSERNVYENITLDKDLILQRIANMAGEQRTLVFRIQGATRGPQRIMSFGSIEGSSGTAPAFRVNADTAKYDEYVRGDYARMAPATITEATYVDYDGIHNSDEEIFLKNYSDSSKIHDRVGFIELQLPSAVYASQFIKEFKLRLFKISAKENANVSVYLAPDDNNLTINSSISSRPALRERLGGFSVSANGEQEFVETALDKEILLSLMANNPQGGRKIILGLKLDEPSATNMISFASDDYLVDYRPKVSVAFNRDVIAGAYNPVLMAPITGNTYTVGRSTKSFDNDDVIGIKSSSSVTYRRSSYVEFELPSDHLDSSNIEQMTLSLYQVSSNATFEAPIYVTEKAELPKGFTTYEGPKPVEQVGTLRVDRGSNNGFARADLDVSKVMKQMKALGENNKKIVLRIDGSTTSGYHLAFFASARSTDNMGPSVALSLKQDGSKQPSTIQYLNIIASSDQPFDSSINMDYFSVSDSNGKAVTLDSNNIIERGPVIKVNNGALLQQSITLQLPNAMSKLRTLSLEHSRHSRGNDARIRYDVLASSDGKNYSAIGELNTHIDKREFANRVSFIDLDRAHGAPGVDRIIEVNERNAASYFKSQYIHSSRFRYDFAPVEVQQNAYVDIWVPRDLPEGTKVFINRTSGPRKYPLRLSPGLNTVKLPRRYQLSFLVGVSGEPTKTTHGFRYRVRQGIPAAIMRDGHSTNEALVHKADNTNAESMFLLGDRVVFYVTKSTWETRMPYWRELDFEEVMGDYNNRFGPIVSYVHGITPNAALRENREDDSLSYYRSSNGRVYLAADTWFVVYHSSLTQRVFDQSKQTSQQTIGYWGMAHEVGHQYQNRWFMITGMGEVVCNIPAIAMRAHVSGPQAAFKSFESQSVKFLNNLAKVEDFRDSWDIGKVTMFQQLFALFGEGIFRDMHRMHRHVLNNEYKKQYGPKLTGFNVTSETKSGHLVYIVSKARELNMIEFFEGLKFPISEDYRNKINALGYPAGPSKETATMTPYQIYQTRGLPDTAYDYKDLSMD